MPSYNQEIVDLNKVIDSLTLTGRADLEKRFNVKTSDVYVDLMDPYHADWLNPSPKSLISFLKNKRTVFILGRKGTGKSTLFQVLKDINNQEIERDLKNKDEINEILIYINAREAFDLSTIVASEEIGADLRFLNFLDVFMESIIKNLKEFFFQEKKWYKRFFNKYKSNFEHFEKELNSIQESMVIKIEKSESQDKTIRERQAEKESRSSKLELSIKPATKFDTRNLIENELEVEKKTHDKIIQLINPTKILQNIKELLISNFEIKNVVILLDDFSEISQKFMNELIEKVISPQITASNPYYYFKIAAYPSRLTTGDIPADKVEYIGIDIGDIFAWGRKADKELPFNKKIERGIEYTKILIQRRCEKIANNNNLFDKLFPNEEKSNVKLYQLLFYSCLTNPRILGYVLRYSLKHALLAGTKLKIEIGHINQAAKDYFERMIDKNYFQKKGKIKQAFDDKLNLATQEMIFNGLLEIAKKNQILLIESAKEGKSKLLKEIYSFYNVIFNGHFRIQKGNLAELLKSLELNQYITQFSEGRSRDKSVQTNLYFFNYGLCLEKDLDFGIPTDTKHITRPDKFISQDRNFDYSDKLIAKLKNLMDIRCENLNCTFKPIPIEKEDFANYLGWKCPTCSGVLIRKPLPDITENVLKRYKRKEEKIRKKFSHLLTDIQYEIIQTLSNFEEEVLAKDVSVEVNLSSRSIGLRMKKLNEYGLVDIINSSPKKYKITSIGQNYLE